MFRLVQVENYTDVIKELSVLFPAHFEELSQHKDKYPLSPRYDVYEAMNFHGKLFISTIRIRGELIGYFVGIVDYHLHYSTCKTCTMDIFYIRQDSRLAFNGLALLRFTKAKLIEMGVNEWVLGTKCNQNIAQLFKRVGFSIDPVEHYHKLTLG